MFLIWLLTKNMPLFCCLKNLRHGCVSFFLSKTPVSYVFFVWFGGGFIQSEWRNLFGRKAAALKKMLIKRAARNKKRAKSGKFANCGLNNGDLDFLNGVFYLGYRLFCLLLAIIQKTTLSIFPPHTSREQWVGIRKAFLNFISFFVAVTSCAQTVN